ncbi:glycosyltransferase 87 family protein [Nonomuraea sp. NBC_01738]|uniref:glycosyltransferase 87 family protein n=1 Tax=Nonomuraea sp. NBC_01738 TaxID=2976003 RepID=UPI002E159879|nr:glycosyltransferase 87 family protein [Nonomuraea sp. NBC_01738]
MKAAGVLVLLAAVVVATVAGAPRLGWYLAAWALFGLALWLARGLPVRRMRLLVVGGGVVLAATGLVAPPNSSTDSFRYAWDGRVQAAAIPPYDHPPADPALAPLRDAWLFPAACSKPGLYPLPDGGCTRINRPTVPTIYPPVAEAYFLLVHRLSPGGARHKGLQAGGWLLAVAVLLLLVRHDPRTAACWAWCPAVPIEAVNNAHVDALAVLLVVLALTVRRGRGALLGAAIATKFLPVTVLPGALAGRPSWRRVLTVLGQAAVVIALAYLPYLLLSAGSVAGYLPGYLREESYDSAGGGNRYLLLRVVLPDAWAPYAAIVLLGLSALFVIRYGDADRPWDGALLVTGSMFLLLTPGYSWYALLVVALAAMAGRWEWLGVALAGAVAYVTGPTAGALPATIAYGVAALAVLTARRTHDLEAVR